MSIDCADGAEAQFQQHILPEEHRIQRVSEGRKIFRYKIRDLLAHTGLQEIADNGGVGLAGVDLVERRERPAPAAPAIDLPECDDDNAKRIIAFVSGLLERMDSSAEVKVYEQEKGRYKVLLVGERLGQLIGHRGETLDAIQQLTNYAVNTGTDKRIRIQMDAENYRARREQSLESLARKVAAKVQKYRRSVTLEPMNAYERHVIHATLQDVKGVTTYSVGTEPNRRVVVAFDRGEAR